MLRSGVPFPGAETSHLPDRWTTSVFSLMCLDTRGGHLLGNLTFILLLGPILEERYGTGEITFMIFATALATGFANILLSPNHLVGASGVVFMLIILASIVDFRKGTIPLSFLLIALIFIGKEVSDALSKDDNVSQLAHIVGGLVGAFFFGFRLKK